MVSWTYTNGVNSNSEELAHPLAGLPGSDPNIVENLAVESDGDLYWSDLMEWGREAEAQGQHQLAFSIYQRLSDQGTHENLQARARARMEVLNGGGSVTDRLEFLGQEFLPQVSDPSLIAGMWVAGRTFRGIQQGLLPLFAPRTWLGHSAIWSTAFAGEVGGFVMAGRGVRHLQGRAVDGSLAGWGHELRHAGFTLLGLKAFGMGTLHFLGPLARSPWFARALPTAAMTAGVMGTRALEMQLGWLPQQNAEQFILDSAVTVLHFKALHGMLSVVPGPAGTHTPIRRGWAPQVQRLIPATELSGRKGSLVFSMGSSSSRPPALETETTEAPVRVPKSSGVRAVGRESIYGELKNRLDGIEKEIHDLF
ncbi:MAG: hypothetical protein R3257_05985, partial [bacterium]|nr:hypothetical protein [bacterium]